MNKRIRIAIAAISALVVGIGQNFADSQEINKFNPNLIILPQETAWVQHDSLQSLPLRLAARDGKEEDCHWLGTCKDKD